MPAICTFRVDSSMKNQDDEPLQSTPRPKFHGKEISGCDKLPMAGQKLFPCRLTAPLGRWFDAPTLQNMRYLLENADVEKLQGCAIDLNGRPGIFLFVPQVQKVFSNLIGAELVGRFMEVLGESPSAFDVGVDGRFRGVAKLQLLDHSLSEACHPVNPFRSPVYPSA
jgi:hypothetical protein